MRGGRACAVSAEAPRDRLLSTVAVVFDASAAAPTPRELSLRFVGSEEETRTSDPALSMFDTTALAFAAKPSSASLHVSWWSLCPVGGDPKAGRVRI